MEYKNRELIQVLTLAEVCREVGSSLIFQGRTAIRAFFGGARTSEDLDFYVDVRALTKGSLKNNFTFLCQGHSSFHIIGIVISETVEHSRYVPIAELYA